MDDKQLITTLGGATRLAELLGFDKKTGGAQRVHNWKERGIPSFIKLQRPDLFATPKRAKRTAKNLPAEQSATDQGMP